MDKSENLPGSSLSPQITRDYNIVRLLGKGGMGEVYQAEQLRVGRRPVALKVLNRSCCDDPDLKRRFENEAASAGRIHHRNVVMVYECRATDDGQLYVAMEYVHGRDLGHLLEERGTVSLEETVRIIKQAAAGLSAAHKLGIVHRDVKPANIMLTEDEDGSLLVKVLDFGIARLSEADSSGAQTKTGVVMGTPHYMSPEQTLGQTGERIDHRSDIYSLAMVAYQMLTGRVAFESDSWVQVMLKHVNEAPKAPSQTRPDLGHLGLIDAVIFKGLEKDREKRQQSANEFAKELEAACHGPGYQGTDKLDTARYPAQPRGLPFGATTPVPGDSPVTPVQPAADTAYTPTVLTTPLPVGAGGTGQVGTGDTSGGAQPPNRDPESFATVAMSPSRPTGEVPGYVGTGVAAPMPSSVAGMRQPSPVKSGGKKIAAAVSAIILLGLAAAAYVVLRGGKPSGQTATDMSAVAASTPAQSPTVEPTTNAPSSAVSPTGSPSPNANKNAKKEEGKEEPKKEPTPGVAKPLGQETPRPERNPHDTSPAVVPVHPTPQPTVQPTPAPTVAATQPDADANCIGVLVLGKEGNPVGGAFVTIKDQTSGSESQARTGPKGRARFCDRVIGHRYMVTAVGPRGMMSGSAQHTMVTGHNPVQIQLQ